jgi:tetratricopeptide (TPR) repeat protein
VDVPRRDEIQSILGQVSPLGPDARAQLLSEVCAGDAELRALLEERVAQIDSIALDAIASPPSCSDTHEFHPSPFPTEPDGTEAWNGEPIDEYCDRRRLNIPARLKLFATVCEAVQLAHQHAVIHRDLKPGHILVTPDGVPKLINFGVASRVQHRTGGDHGLVPTSAALPVAGELVPTPEYASPEQVQGEVITTASDVYALGVVLYRLLCGRWPYHAGTGTAAEIVQAICEQVPEKPSEAVNRRMVEPPIVPNDSPPPIDIASSSSTATEIAAARGLTPRQLTRLLTGDLDTIVLKALRKEPEWRYASAEQFRQDLGRYHKRRPLKAGASSRTDRVAKFLRRNRAAVIAGVLSLLVVVSSITGITMGLVTAHRQRDRAEASFARACQTVDQIFTRINESPALDQPGLDQLRTTLLRDTRAFYEDFLRVRGHDPLRRADLATARAHLARIASLNSSHPEAIAQYQQAITLWEKLVADQPGHEDYQANLARTLSDFGALLLSMEGRVDEALGLFRRAKELVDQRLAVDPQSVRERQNLAMVLLNIAEIQRRQGNFDQAIVSAEQVVAIESRLAAEDGDSFESRRSLAAAYSILGRLFGAQPGESLQAIAAFQQAIELRAAITRERPELTDQLYHLATELDDLASHQQTMGQLEPALEHFRQALAIFERLAQLYPGVATYHEGLGMTYNLMTDVERQRGENAEALAFAQKARVVFEQLITENPHTISYQRDLAKTYNNLGRLLAQVGKPEDALGSFQRAIDRIESLPRPDPRDSYNLACNAALCIPLIGVKNGSQGTSQAPSKGDLLRRKLYGDRAIEALRRSAVSGFLGPERFQDSTDLDPLHDRADFRAFVKEVEEKPDSSGK